MECSKLEINNLLSTPTKFEKTSSKIALGAVFADRGMNYLNEYTLFVAHFNEIPNSIEEGNINCRKANQWFANKYKSEIKTKYFNKKYLRSSQLTEYDDIFYILFDDLIVEHDQMLHNLRVGL